MRALTAKEAKDGFGRLIDLARSEPVTVAKHGRAVVVAAWASASGILSRRLRLLTTMVARSCLGRRINREHALRSKDRTAAGVVAHENSLSYSLHIRMGGETSWPRPA